MSDSDEDFNSDFGNKGANGNQDVDNIHDNNLHVDNVEKDVNLEEILPVGADFDPPANLAFDGTVQCSHVESRSVFVSNQPHNRILASQTLTYKSTRSFVELFE